MHPSALILRSEAGKVIQIGGKQLVEPVCPVSREQLERPRLDLVASVRRVDRPLTVEVQQRQRTSRFGDTPIPCGLPHAATRSATAAGSLRTGSTIPSISS